MSMLALLSCKNVCKMKWANIETVFSLQSIFITNTSFITKCGSFRVLQNTATYLTNLGKFLY